MRQPIRVRIPQLLYRYARTRLKQALCHHRVYIQDIHRIDADRVEGECHRCRKVLSAPYGLALPCGLESR